MSTSRNLDSITILIVDDNQSDRMILKQALMTLGFVLIQEAEDGRIAQHKIDKASKRDVPFELIFVDLKMPWQSGMYLLESLRHNPKKIQPYVIMMTASSFAENVQTAMSKGVDDFLVKPIELDGLRLKLEKYLDRHGIDPAKLG